MTFSMEVRQLYTWKLLSSCLKLSTYSFVYRECGLLQNEKVRERSSVTQTPTLFPCTLPNKFMESLGQVVTGFLILLEDLENSVYYFIHASVSFFLFPMGYYFHIRVKSLVFLFFVFFFSPLSQCLWIKVGISSFLKGLYVFFCILELIVFYSYSSICINLTITLAPKSLRKVSCRNL